MNMHVVGPPETRPSHGFLVLLNSYSGVVTLGSKVVVFTLEYKTLGVGEACAHVGHLLSTVWAALYAIRCRQLALDCYEGTDVGTDAQSAQLGTCSAQCG